MSIDHRFKLDIVHSCKLDCPFVEDAKNGPWRALAVAGRTGRIMVIALGLDNVHSGVADFKACTLEIQQQLDDFIRQGFKP